MPLEGLSKKPQTLDKRYGLPNRTPLEMPKTYPTDIIGQIEKIPPPICGYINVWELLLHLTDNVKYLVNSF